VDTIVLDGVTKRYSSGIRDTHLAVDHLSLSIPQGEVFGFLGPNGAGKSTTIKMLLNLVFPTSGQSLILGQSVADPMIRRRVGYLPESPTLYDCLTPDELLWFGGKTSGVSAPDIRSRTAALLDLVDLGMVRHQRLRTFSKGMVQRAGVALALVNDPEVVVFDEPMSGLDPLGRKLMSDIIRRLKQEGKTVFFSSHILHDVEDLCDRFGIIVKGKLRRVAGIAELCAAPSRGWRINVKGADDRIRSALDGMSWTSTARGGLAEIQTDEKDVGRLIDRLQGAGCEVMQAAPLRPTLEDIVLQEVARAAEDVA
jgi:ABC-2 type transport system ATP-binding protein